MRPLIVANWKMNPQTLAEAKRLFNSVKRGIKDVKKVEVVICPPFVFLPSLNLAGKSSRLEAIKLGAQDCFWERKGAYTGEVSPPMLKKLGCQYVICGHSERRALGETDQIINKKIKAAIIVKLKPIFCIGETQIEREKGKTPEILKSQIKKGLAKISKKEIKNIILAYEPVWAIGTGNPCNLEEAQKIALLIKKIIAKLFSQRVSENLPILYGGSVDSKNARGYIKEARMDGFIIGGASLNPQEFIQIVKNVSRG